MTELFTYPAIKSIFLIDKFLKLEKNIAVSFNYVVFSIIKPFIVYE